MPDWTDNPRIFDPNRTVVLAWTKYSAKDPTRVRQYALWTSGQLITRIARGERRYGAWSERVQMRFTKKNIVALDKLLKSHGYQREFKAPSKNFIISRRVSSL